MAVAGCTHQGPDAQLARSPRAKETPQKLRRFIGQNSLLYDHFMIELRMIYDRKHRSSRAGFGIGSSEDQPVNPRMNHGSGTHGARFQRHVEGAAVEPVVAEASRRFTKGHDFSVGRRVNVPNDPVLSFADDGAVRNNYRTDRHFTGLSG